MRGGIYSYLRALGGSFLVHVGLGARASSRGGAQQVRGAQLRAARPQPAAARAWLHFRGPSRPLFYRARWAVLGFGYLRLSREIRKYPFNERDLIRGA